MITLRNAQRTIKVDTKRLKQIAQQILTILEYPDYDLGILITTDRSIQRYNRIYRHIDKPTDILSFPYHDTLKAGHRIVPLCNEDKNLGDIIIAPAYVVHDLSRWEVSFEKRMDILIVHGICHLLGYDHISDKDYEIMHEKEQFILNML